MMELVRTEFLPRRGAADLQITRVMRDKGGSVRRQEVVLAPFQVIEMGAALIAFGVDVDDLGGYDHTGLDRYMHALWHYFDRPGATCCEEQMHKFFALAEPSPTIRDNLKLRRFNFGSERHRELRRLRRHALDAAAFHRDKKEDRWGAVMKTIAERLTGGERGLNTDEMHWCDIFMENR